MEFFKVSPGGFFLLALLLLCLPLPWAGAVITAAAFHELCHGAVLWLLDVRIRGFSLGCRGAKLHLPVLSPGTQILSAAAGPAGSLLLALLIRRIPRIGFCALVQGLFNLLPLSPLDGGRILRSLHLLISSRKDL